MTWLLLFVTVGAVARLTIYVQGDLVGRPVRVWATKRYPSKRKREPDLAYLVYCPWCLSTWMAPLPVVAAVWWPTNRAVLAVLICLTASLVTGLLANNWNTPHADEDDEMAQALRELHPER